MSLDAHIKQRSIEMVKLAQQVEQGNIARVEAMLAAGASLNGSQEIRPIVTASFHRKLNVVKLLIKKGANVNASVYNPFERFASSRCFLPMQGEGSLHIVASSLQIDIVRVLLRAGADPNARSADGTTPFMSLSSRPFEEDDRELFLKVALVLLEAGADPALVDKGGVTALFHAADAGNPDMVNIILCKTPSTINRASREGKTALHQAAFSGHAGVVSQLLLAGATHPRTMDHDHCPLAVAVIFGHDEVVRVLLADGIDAVGGVDYAIPMALAGAVGHSRAKILRMALSAQGEENQKKWTRCPGFLAGSLLHYAAGYIVPAAVSVLLAAGANADATDGAGQRPIDVIGTMDAENPPLGPLTPRIPTRNRDPVKEATILRTLQRAPAFHARSWMWPAGTNGGGRDGAAAGASAGAAAWGNAALCGQGRRKAPLGVQVLQPTSSTRSGTVFVRLVDRYSRKQ